MGWLVWKRQRTAPLRRSNARTTPSPPPAKPRPLAVVVTPPRSGSGVLNFQIRRPVVTSVAEEQLAALLRRRQLLLREDRRRLRRGVHDDVPPRVVRGGRVVEPADRR